jgi:hypothetical protein
MFCCSQVLEHRVAHLSAVHQNFRIDLLCVCYPNLYNKSSQQDGTIAEMGLWENNIWSWKIEATYFSEEKKREKKIFGRGSFFGLLNCQH